jgi:exopolysaccharide/PEP-CTERM locus tyrosine autokinase
VDKESQELPKTTSPATLDAKRAHVKRPRQATKPREVSITRPRQEKVPTIIGTEKPRAPKAPPVREAHKSEPRVQPAPVSARPGTAAIRYSEKAIDPNLVSLLDPQSYEAEQFKILRTNILFPVEGMPPRSILVTSAGPGEGKTFAAANLAISIAMNINKHVLLIDGDMRKPEQHTKFGFGKLPGLTDYLTQGVALTSLLVKTKVEKLSLLPAGEPPPNPSELVSSEQMSNLIEEVTNRYQDRIIVIDSPPPTVAAETGVLARQVDGILLVVSYQKTRFEDAADLIEIMGEEKIIGSMVNFIDPKATRSYGYRQYGQYGRK